MTDFPPAVGPELGMATLIIQDHADSPTRPPERTLKCEVKAILPNPDGSYTMPDGSRFVLPE